MIRLLKIIALFLVVTQVSAQSGIVKGTLTDALTNEPISFANVLVIGTDAGAVTDIDGSYEIIGIKPGLYASRQFCGL